MVWITREHPKIDRIAFTWPTLRFLARVHIDGASRKEVPLSRPLSFRPHRHPLRGFTCTRQSIVRRVDPSE